MNTKFPHQVYQNRLQYTENSHVFFTLLRCGEIIDGAGEDVEIDEYMVAKRKYNRGRVLKRQIWIFGGVVKTRSEQFFIEVFEKRISP